MQTRKPNPTLEAQYKLQGECCYYCKRSVPFEDITRDHVLPISKGHTLENNKVFACRPCNALKGNRDIEELKTVLLTFSCNILKQVVHQKFKISDSQLQRIRYYVTIMKTLSEMIENGNKPTIIFT